MNYPNYEDYMRSVLGYQGGDIYTNTYNPQNSYYYDIPMITNDYTMDENDDFNMFYPEIYKLIYPMVCKICNQNMNREITKDLIDKMTDEIYLNFEAEDIQNSNTRVALKKGDVRNPNAKENDMRQETRQRNFMLRDLIKILILRELIKQRKKSMNVNRYYQPYRPPMPPRPPIMRQMNQWI